MKITSRNRRYAASAASLALAALLVGGCSDDGVAPTVAAGGTASSNAVASPATLAGGCRVLVGQDDLLGQVRAFATEPGRPDRAAVQEKVFGVVAAGNDELGDAAGQLVDFLDDPEAYLDGGTLSAKVEAAFTDIRTACAKVGS